jgi:hypothetical protein
MGEVEWDELVEKFSESIGEEKAEDLVEKAAEEAELRKKNDYTKDEAVQLLKAVTDLDDSTTYTNIAANSMQTNLNTEGHL